MNRSAYIGIIKNDLCDVKTIVMAENQENAKSQVIEKFYKGLGRTFCETDVQILHFTDVY